MARIKADVDALRRNSAEINRNITELQNLNAGLERLLSNMADSWSGEACDAYILKMREYQRKSNQMVRVLTEFKQYIGEAATRFEQKDREHAAKIRGC